MKIRLSLLSTVFLLTFIHAGAQDNIRMADLNTLQPSWSAVQGGSATADFTETSYGFIIPNDGRLITGYSASGKQYWYQSVNGKTTPYLTVNNDFLLCVTSDDTLNFLNRNGKTVWSRKTEFNITQSPIAGRDFRIFIRGNTRISCYGLNGIRKWTLTVSLLSTLPLCELNDGSILAFIAEESQSRTKALRISPFGNIIEEITFAGRVINACTAPDGVMLLFYNNSCGLCSIKDGNAGSAWVLNNLKTTTAKSRIISSASKNITAVVSSAGQGSNLYVINSQTGELISTLTLKDISSEQITAFSFSQDGFFISDLKTAAEVSYGMNVIWKAVLPPSSQWNCISYTSSNYLLLAMKNWEINAWLMNQGLSHAHKEDRPEEGYVEKKRSSNIMESAGVRVLSLEQMEEISAGLLRGDYGEQEKEWLKAISTEIANYTASHEAQKKNFREGKTFFEDNPVYTQNLIRLVSQTGIAGFSEDFAYLLKNEENSTQTLQLIMSCGNYAYDPDGSMLKALQYLIQNSLLKRDISKAKAICDATLQICAFMGKPALLKYGMDNMMYLLNPKFDKAVSDYARATFKKITDLNL